jgi:hypothetical protein
MIAGHQINVNRDLLDFYPTDPRWLGPLMTEVQFDGEIHEPCAGDGSISNHLKSLGHLVRAYDIRPRSSEVVASDALSIGTATNVITNPPYGPMMYPLLDHWHKIVTGKLALLVKLNFLEAQSRTKYLVGSNTPNLVIVVTGRMKVFGKTSQFPHAWIVWDKTVPNAQTCILKVKGV